ncbi:MAG: ATP-binding protein [Dehalobacterium sp.]
MHSIQKDSFHLERLVLFRNFREDPLLIKFKNVVEDRELLREQDFYHLCADLVCEAETHHWSGNLWHHHLTLLLAQAENVFSRTCAFYGEDILEGSILQLALHDLRLIQNMYHFDWRSLCTCVPPHIVDSIENFTLVDHEDKKIALSEQNLLALQETFPWQEDPTMMAKILIDFYYRTGYGPMCLFSSFHWQDDAGLVGIQYPDLIRLDDLIGYEDQKKIILNNTETFVRGKKANHVLLYGERGTGKSSTIKALVNEYWSRGLRLVEVHKGQFASLPLIMRKLRDFPQRFLVFLDDLSFESNETDYKYLKYLLEGGMEMLPDNVVIYATSNRRHLVRENWQDREGGGEVNIRDSVSEKLSLADRFGITVTYTSPDQDQYVEIVMGLAEQYRLDLPPELLKEKALIWERWYNGRSGRTAKQFIQSLFDN